MSHEGEKRTIQYVLTEVFLWAFAFVMLIALAILLWWVLPITIILQALGV